MDVFPVNWDSVPEVMNKEQFFRICHISKSTALHLLKSGKVPCEWSGKKTRCYKIRKEDVKAYLEERAIFPELYSAPKGWYGTHYVARLSKELPEDTLRQMHGYYEKLLRKYQLTDKFFLEDHTAPGQQIEVHYRLEAQQEYLADELTEMYDGIYVKDFILFFGEKVQYYILESQTADGQIGASGCLGNGDIMEEGSGDRYAWLNEMLLACTLDDREKLAGKMKRYYGMTKVTEEAYRLL